MKKKIFLISATMIAFFLILVSCAPQPKNNVVVNNPDKVVEGFPSEKYLQLANSSILEFSCTESKGQKKKAWQGHCCLYCNRGDYSYLIMPNHCFPYDSTKSYKISATDFKGRTIELNWEASCALEEGDARILVVERIEGLPTLCESGIIAGNYVVGDTAILLVPFNVRNVYQKIGIFRDDNQVEMSILFGEPGDSGGLIISRNGVIGMNSSISDDGKFVNFIPMSIFEVLYGSLINSGKDPA